MALFSCEPSLYFLLEDIVNHVALGTMSLLARSLYVDVVRSTIEVTKAMKYPAATSVEVNDILASIKDLKCNVWRKYLKGATIMKPEDIVVDDEVPENEDDLVIQGPILGKEATEAEAEAIHKLPPLLLADTKKQLRNLFEHTMQAHQHAAEASKCLKELHEALPLNVSLHIANSAVRPLVILHIPKTEDRIANSAVCPLGYTTHPEDGRGDPEIERDSSRTDTTETPTNVVPQM